MIKERNISIFIVVIVALITISYFMFSTREVVRLGAAEIREYRGKRLSSINDFRENSIKGPQYIDIEDYSLRIIGLVKNPKTYSYQEVIDHQNYEKPVTLHCVEGWSATILWQGILVRELIEETEHLPGANTVIFRAYDGYSTSLPLDYIFSNNIIIAHKMNNITLPSDRGYPFQLVAENKWGYKWIKWITEIELSDNPNYRGYWESRGYSNDADQDQYFLE